MNSGFGLVTHDVRTALALLRGSLQELIFFYQVGPGDHTQVVRVGIMHCYSRNQQKTLGFPYD